MLSCKDFVQQQNEKLDGQEFSFMQRLSLNMHYFICVHCRRYTKQLFLVDEVSEKLDSPSVEKAKIDSCIDHIHQIKDQKEN